MIYAICICMCGYIEAFIVCVVINADDDNSVGVVQLLTVQGHSLDSVNIRPDLQ